MDDRIRDEIEANAARRCVGGRRIRLPLGGATVVSGVLEVGANLWLA